VDWVNYLVAGGAPASQVIESEDGNLIESVDDQQGGTFLATVFEYAEGIPAWDFGWDDALYRSMGITLGRNHRLTKGYQPKDPDAKRPQWDDRIMLVDRTWLPNSEMVVWEKYVQIVDWCRQLPKTEQDYGLIHFDVHAMNFFVDGTGSLNLFDFDDCHYSWFANDIAIVLFYMALGQEDVAEFSLDFMTEFIQGYKLENQFEKEWLTQLPNFLKMREIDLYAIIHRSFDVESMTDEWNLRYMNGRKEKIENDVPYIDLDFTRLADLL
jgi:Ser/Thr protein kinase RdoA (MazF antagonist)